MQVIQVNPVGGQTSRHNTPSKTMLNQTKMKMTTGEYIMQPKEFEFTTTPGKIIMTNEMKINMQFDFSISNTVRGELNPSTRSFGYVYRVQEGMIFQDDYQFVSGTDKLDFTTTVGSIIYNTITYNCSTEQIIAGYSWLYVNGAFKVNGNTITTKPLRLGNNIFYLVDGNLNINDKEIDNKTTLYIAYWQPRPYRSICVAPFIQSTLNLIQSQELYRNGQLIEKHENTNLIGYPTQNNLPPEIQKRNFGDSLFDQSTSGDDQGLILADTRYFNFYNVNGSTHDKLYLNNQVEKSPGDNTNLYQWDLISETPTTSVPKNYNLYVDYGWTYTLANSDISRTTSDDDIITYTNQVNLSIPIKFLFQYFKYDLPSFERVEYRIAIKPLALKLAQIIGGEVKQGMNSGMMINKQTLQAQYISTKKNGISEICGIPLWDASMCGLTRIYLNYTQYNIQKEPQQVVQDLMDPTKRWKMYELVPQSGLDMSNLNVIKFERVKRKNITRVYTWLQFMDDPSVSQNSTYYTGRKSMYNSSQLVDFFNNQLTQDHIQYFARFNLYYGTNPVQTEIQQIDSLKILHQLTLDSFNKYNKFKYTSSIQDMQRWLIKYGAVVINLQGDKHSQGIDSNVEPISIKTQVMNYPNTGAIEVDLVNSTMQQSNVNQFGINKSQLYKNIQLVALFEYSVSLDDQLMFRE